MFHRLGRGWVVVYHLTNIPSDTQCQRKCSYLLELLFDKDRWCSNCCHKVELEVIVPLGHHR